MRKLLTLLQIRIFIQRNVHSSDYPRAGTICIPESGVLGALLRGPRVICLLCEPLDLNP